MISVLVAMAASTVLSPCDDLKLSDAAVEKHVLQDLLPVGSKRAQLIDELRAGKSTRCGGVLRNYVAAIERRKESAELLPLRLLILEVAGMGKLSGTADVLERDAFADCSADVLAVLEKVDAARHSASLTKWAHETAGQIRSSLGATLGDESQYGLNSIPDSGTGKQMSRVAAPLFLERYLSLLVESKEKLTAERLEDLNAIYAGTPASHRNTFLPMLTQLLSANSAAWITSFRKENVVLQARLFPLFEAVGGAEVVKELLWLSVNHADTRIRALAERTLDAVLGKSAH